MALDLKKRAHDDREIGFWGAVSIGIGGMVGGGIFAGLGIVACLLALGALVWHTLQNAPGQLWVLVIMVSIAFVVEGVVIVFYTNKRNAA